MTRLMFYTTLIMVFTVSVAVYTASAKLHQNTLMIDATDRENWAYLDLTEGETVDIADAASSLAWDLGFKRTAVIVNGGLAVPEKPGHWFLRTSLLKMSLKPRRGSTFPTPTKLRHSRAAMVGIPTQDRQITGFCRIRKSMFCGLRLMGRRGPQARITTRKSVSSAITRITKPKKARGTLL